MMTGPFESGSRMWKVSNRNERMTTTTQARINCPKCDTSTYRRIRASLLIILIVLLVASCGTSVGDPDEKYGFDRSMAPLLAAADITAQEFQVDNQRDTVLFGKRGTIVSVPANCFTNATAPVKVELIEALDMSDLLLLNAPTVSEGRLLVTDGVVYVNAFAEGKALTVKEGTALEIEVPSSQLDTGMTAFVGAFDPTGRLTWRLGNEMKKAVAEEIRERLTYEFLTIPMELFPNRAQYFRMDSIARAHLWVKGELHAPDDDLLIGKERAAFYADAVRFLNDPASAGTPLATREFARRLASLEAYYYYWYQQQPDGSAELIYDVFGPFQHRIFQVYLANMDRDLWYSDSLALAVMDEWVPIDKKDSTELSSYKDSRATFEGYAQQRLTKPVVIDDHGVDLNTPNAYRALLEKGVGKDEARRLLELNGFRQEAIAELKGQAIATQAAIAQEDQRIKEERKSNAVRYYLIKANQLGWINVDQFYSAPNAKECEVIASVKAPEGTDVMNVSLVLNGSKTLVDGIQAKDGSYHFTQDKDYYRSLPVGEEATMVAIAYTDGKPWLALRRITIAERMNEKLELTAMGMDEFQTALKGLN